MTTTLEAKPREYGSGDIVEPGDYIDLETGAMVHVHERDELPEGTRIVHYHRYFQRVDGSQPKLLPNVSGLNCLFAVKPNRSVLFPWNEWFLANPVRR